MRIIIVFITTFLIVSILGCSRFAYDALQEREQELCRENHDPGAALERCLERVQQSYEDYEQEREAL